MIGEVRRRECACGTAFVYVIRGRGRPPRRCRACRPPARSDPQEPPLTRAQRAYLDAFDSFLLADRLVDQGRARARMDRHLTTMVEESGASVDMLQPRQRRAGPAGGVRR